MILKMLLGICILIIMILWTIYWLAAIYLFMSFLSKGCVLTKVNNSTNETVEIQGISKIIYVALLCLLWPLCIHISKE